MSSSLIQLHRNNFRKVSRLYPEKYGYTEQVRFYLALSWNFKIGGFLKIFLLWFVRAFEDISLGCRTPGEGCKPCRSISRNPGREPRAQTET